MDLKDKVIIVSGAAKGIGEAVSLLLDEYGAHVIGIDVDDAAGEILRKQLHSGTFLHCNISSEADVRNVRDTVLKQYGHIDILVNNAAVQTEKSFFDMTPADFQRDITVNLIGTYTMIRLCSEVMEPGSSILNMLSVHHNVPRLNKFGYDASKAGIAMLTRESALALADRRITVNGISYGAVKTPMNEDWIHDEAKVEAVKNKIPLRWIADAKEIASSVKVILEDFSDCATGTIFTIDGGRSLL